MSDLRVVAAGDAVLVAEFADRIDPALNARAIGLSRALGAERIAGVRDIVPTFRSVAVYFDPLVTDAGALARRLRNLGDTTIDDVARDGAQVDIPVCYDPEFGADLEDVARFAGLTPDDVVAIHSGDVYRVFMLGFVPGFAYLGTVDERIAAPRRASPRIHVPAGSVAIAGRQTGVYPSRTPGGWNIIGRTPLSMVSFDREKPSLLGPGDAVRFHPIDRREFDRAVGAPAEQPA
jgi:inhibitor of KinA